MGVRSVRAHGSRRKHFALRVAAMGGEEMPGTHPYHDHHHHHHPFSVDSSYICLYLFRYIKFTVAVALSNDLGVSENTPQKINSQLMYFCPHKFSPISCCSSMSAMTKRVCWAKRLGVI